MSAAIYQIGGGDKCLILDTRQAMIYPFVAPSWMDLRIGFFLSLCRATNNADITSLAETLTTLGTPSDRFWVGIKQNNSILPNTAGTTFIGYCSNPMPENPTSSILQTSDIAIGATNNNYWRHNNVNANALRMINGTTAVNAGASCYPHFPQNAVNAGGNATLILLRLTRASGVATSMVVAGAGSVVNSGDVLYDSVCAISTIRAQFRSATWATHNLATADIVTVPDALYAYWPFISSKLRIHAVCLEKFA